MKLKQGFITREMYGEHLTVSAGGEFNGFLRSNATAAYILECLAQETSSQEILRKMQEKYDAPTQILAEDVEKVLATLRKIGALDE